MKIINEKELYSLKSETPNLTILDVRLAEEYEAEHIPGAKGNCVFEVAFLDRLMEVVPDKGAPICLYGMAEGSFESRMAAEKLVRTGYLTVYDFRGGLNAWCEAGNPVEGVGKREAQESEPLEGERVVDTGESAIEWAGRNMGSKHWGTLRLKSGSLTFRKGLPAAGSIIIDMNSVTDLNIEESELRKILEDHLKSDDFFDVERYPEARLDILGAEPIRDATQGLPNLAMKGTLTMRGVTNTVTFDSASGLNEEGHWVAQANFDIDRTRWNIFYGSGRFFQNLGMHVVNDLISLQVKIAA